MSRSLQNSNLFFTGDKFKLSYPRNIQIHKRVLLCGFEIIEILPNSWKTDFKKISKVMSLDIHLKGKLIYISCLKIYLYIILKKIFLIKIIPRKKMKANIVQNINGIRIMLSKMTLIPMILKMKFSIMPKIILPM